MITKFLAKSILWLSGWQVRMELPSCKKYIVIIAPHTSNWDFILGNLAKIIRMWGGIPIDRKNTVNVVDQVATYFEQNSSFVLGITPEGTRKKNPDWKTGFYRIALKANVPIYFGYIDFGTKKIGMHDYLFPTGDMEKDIIQIKAYYKNMKGFYPNQFAI